MREVNGVLAERSRGSGRQAEARSLMAALALHGLILAAVLLAPRLAPPPKPLEFVPVQIIPAQALGVRRPAPPRRKTPPAPPAETPVPDPEPAAAPPKPEPADDVPVLPDPDSKKKKEDPKPAATPAPSRPSADTEKGSTSRDGAKAEEGTSGTAPGETGDQLGRRGGPRGNPLGTTAFGSEVGSLDNPDFTFGYYLDRMLSLIDAQWARPGMGSGVKAVIFFRINRDGSMSDLRVEQSSGYNSFDLAALRAVQNAAPFPPLPRAYKHQDLGVNLIVR
ncbi:MAG TPA: TonB family protein [Thermoanaerobaculia bacterium]|nr:TonB family protein [Thermoanaerobaculia bacterium]